MKLSVAVFCALVAVASAHGWMNTHQRQQQQPQWSWNPMSWTSYGNTGWGAPVEQEPKKDACGCVCKRISIEDKIKLIAKDNDPNGDGVVDIADVTYDVALNYDKNNDAVLSESECVQTYACRHGDTEYFATFACALIFQGLKEINMRVDLSNPPFNFGEGLPLEAFLANSRSRYTRFFNDRCVNTYLSIEQKVSLNAGYNDMLRPDGVVSAEDVEYHLRELYDTNKDGSVTQQEWVARWVCAYGDSADFARFMWLLQTLDAERPSIPVNFFNEALSPENAPLTQEKLKADNRERYEAYRAQNADKYIQQG